MSLPSVISCIFSAEAGLAFPEQMGKTTKLELTTGRPPKMQGSRQATANMVKIGERLISGAVRQAGRQATANMVKIGERLIRGAVRQEEEAQGRQGADQDKQLHPQGSSSYRQQLPRAHGWSGPHVSRGGGGSKEVG
jgi:hypothetical protein